jgi:hypothetical protein
MKFGEPFTHGIARGDGEWFLSRVCECSRQGTPGESLLRHWSVAMVAASLGVVALLRVPLWGALSYNMRFSG